MTSISVGVIHETNKRHAGSANIKVIEQDGGMTEIRYIEDCEKLSIIMTENTVEQLHKALGEIVKRNRAVRRSIDVDDSRRLEAVELKAV